LLNGAKQTVELIDELAVVGTGDDCPCDILDFHPEHIQIAVVFIAGRDANED